VAKPIESSIVACQIVFKILKVIVRIRKKSNAPYVGVNFITINSNKYYIHAADPF